MVPFHILKLANIFSPSLLYHSFFKNPFNLCGNIAISVEVFQQRTFPGLAEENIFYGMILVIDFYGIGLPVIFLEFYKRLGYQFRFQFKL